MYDLDDTIEIEVFSGGDLKICEVRNPTEAEWDELFKNRYTMIRNLGRGSNEAKVINKEKAAAQFLAKIQLNTDIVFEEYEAATIVDQLSECDVLDSSRSGSSYTFTLSTLLGEVTHTVKIPQHKDLKQTIEQTVRVRGERNNSSSVRTYIEPAIALYNSIAETVVGYSVTDPKLVPAVHKYKVVDAIQGEINQMTARSKKDANVPPTIPGR